MEVYYNDFELNESGSFFPVALQSLKDLGRLTYRRFLDLFRHMVGLLGRVISPSQGVRQFLTVLLADGRMW
jgi:hypothetical protein